MSFELSELAYAYDALDPYMSAETMEFHRDKHHAAYIANANNLIKNSGFEGQSIEDICRGAYGKNQALFNNVGQHYNHTEFWNGMKPNGGGNKLPGKLQAAIDSDLGGYDKMRADFINAGMTQFGSGWAWLAVKDGKLEIMKTANADNPLVMGAQPVLACDVWEHTYYIDYRNMRPKYLEAWFDSLINWEYVEQMFEAATS